MINHELFIPTRIIYGEGKHKDVGKYLKKYTSKILLVYGGGSIKKNGLYDDVIKALQENSIEYYELSGIPANPTTDYVDEGIRLCRENDITFIFGVGGGSVIDVSKAIAVGTLYDGDVWDFFSKGTEPKKALPTANILTIPGTGSEGGGNIVISNAQTKEKIGIYNELYRPVFAILDPTLCTTIPQNQISAPIYDMLSHTMERYFTRTLHTDVIDGISEGIMRAIIKNGLSVYHNPSDVQAWGELMIASDFSHNGITGVGREGDWTNHGTEEVISGIYNIPHGVGLSIVTPAWMRYIYKKHPLMFAQFAANVMGVQGSYREPERLALEGIEALENFSRRMGLPIQLSEVNIDESKLEFMAKRACGYKSNGMLGTLEPLAWRDIVEIYKLAL